MCQVSVITPCYNVDGYIRQLIDSILVQTYHDWELILIDDGSADGTRNICQQYALKNARIHTIYQENSGASSARNLGISAAKGKYLCFVDADDWVEDSYIKNMVEIIESEDVELVVGGMKEHSNNHIKIWSSQNISFFQDSFDKALTNKDTGQLLLGPVAKLFKTNIIKENNVKFPTDIRVGEDRMFVYDYLACISSIRFTGSIDYNYRRHINSVSKLHIPFNSVYQDYIAAEKLHAETLVRYDIMSAKADFLSEVRIFHIQRLLSSLMTPMNIIKRAKLLKKINAKYILQYCHNISSRLRLIYILIKHKQYIIASLLISLKSGNRPQSE